MIDPRKVIIDECQLLGTKAESLTSSVRKIQSMMEFLQPGVIPAQEDLRKALTTMVGNSADVSLVATLLPILLMTPTELEEEKASREEKKAVDRIKSA